MSKETTSAVALPSKLLNSKTLLVGFAATAAFVTALTFAPATNALGPDNTNLGIGGSTQDGDEWSSFGLRLVGQDGLENLGVGTMFQNVDGDESQAFGTMVESTDDIDNLSVGTSAATKDGDESSALDLGLKTEDGLENLSTDVNAQKHDGEEHNNFGISFSFDK